MPTQERWSRSNKHGERFKSTDHEFIEGGSLFWENDEQCALCRENVQWHDPRIPPTPEENEAAKQRLRESLPKHIQQIKVLQAQIEILTGRTDRWGTLEEIRTGLEQMQKELQEN